MKNWNILLALPLAASAAVMKIGMLISQLVDQLDIVDYQTEPRQFDLGAAGGLLSGLVGSLANTFGPKAAKAVKIQELTPRNPGAKRIRITWGPFMIKGVNVCHLFIILNFSIRYVFILTRYINRALPNSEILPPWMAEELATNSRPIPTSQQT